MSLPKCGYIIRTPYSREMLERKRHLTAKAVIYRALGRESLAEYYEEAARRMGMEDVA